MKKSQEFHGIIIDTTILLLLIFITASFGVIKVDTSQDLKTQINTLDRKMYKSKAAGKNRVYM